MRYGFSFTMEVKQLAGHRAHYRKKLIYKDKCSYLEIDSVLQIPHYGIFDTGTVQIKN